MEDGGELDHAVGGPKFVWVAGIFALAIQDFLFVHVSTLVTRIGEAVGGIHAVPPVNVCISRLVKKRKPPLPPAPSLLLLLLSCHW